MVRRAVLVGFSILLVGSFLLWPVIASADDVAPIAATASSSAENISPPQPVTATIEHLTLTHDVLIRTKPTLVSIGEKSVKLLSDSDFKIALDDVGLGTFMSDDAGQLFVQIELPTIVQPGNHVLHVYGKDAAGTDIDVYKNVSVSEAIYQPVSVQYVYPAPRQ